MDETENLKALARARMDGDLKAEVQILRRLISPAQTDMAASIQAQIDKLTGKSK